MTVETKTTTFLFLFLKITRTKLKHNFVFNIQVDGCRLEDLVDSKYLVENNLHLDDLDCLESSKTASDRCGVFSTVDLSCSQGYLFDDLKSND